MSRRTVEVFSAGCPLCNGVVEDVRRIADPSWQVTVLDMNDAHVAKRAEDLGIRSIPAVVVDGRLADCCIGRGVDMGCLKAMGLSYF